MILDVMHHDATIDRVFEKVKYISMFRRFVFFKLGFVLKVFNVSCSIRVPYLRSENNLRRFELLSSLTVHIGATFFSQEVFG